MEYYDIIIIGGGAAGMAAAISAKTEASRVLIIEHNDRVGKKILSTGNGKCNFTNDGCRVIKDEEDGSLSFVPNPEGIAPYISDGGSEFAKTVISRFDTDAALSFFRELGMLFLNKNGCYYPRSEQASAVLDLLRFRCEDLGVHILCGYQPMRIQSLRKKNWKAGASEKRPDRIRFQIDDLYTCKSLILAAGGQNASKTGSDGSGYEIAKGLGHSIVPPLPALCGLKCSDPFFKELAGVRTDAELALYEGDGKGEPLLRVFGNLQLNSYGISGIPVFQLSLLAAKLLHSGKKLLVRINFLPELSEEELEAVFKAKKENKFLGILNKKLANVILKESRKAHPNEPEEAYDLVYTHMIRKFKVHPTSALSFEEAQTTRGGVSVNEINPETMESRLVPGLYFAGEIVDVCGICGGYNLHWAWATAHAAAQAAR